MSVETTADLRLDSAKKHLQDAIEDLTPIVVTQDIWGWDNWDPKYRNRIEKAFKLLSKARKQLR